jgi:hypothetical protein
MELLNTNKKNNTSDLHFIILFKLPPRSIQQCNFRQQIVMKGKYFFLYCYSFRLTLANYFTTYLII